MRVKDLGLVPYEAIDTILEEHIPLAKKEDHLLLCTHPPVYTVGSEPYVCDLPLVQTDRGGSVTYFDEGCLMVYFAFLVPSPARFYAKVLQAVQSFFDTFDPAIGYDHTRPGFYIKNQKIASLGFRYKNGTSKHGVSIHIDPDLEAFNRIEPCGLKKVRATSLHEQGFRLHVEEAKALIVQKVKDVFET